MTPMALTAQVKDELARLKVDKTSCRKAEVSTLLRFAGGLHIISGRIVIDADNVTVRNTLVQTGTSLYPIHVESGTTGILIENVEIDILAGASAGGLNGCVLASAIVLALGREAEAPPEDIAEAAAGTGA